jgi:hypothetical protein
MKSGIMLLIVNIHPFLDSISSNAASDASICRDAFLFGAAGKPSVYRFGDA